MPRLPWPEADLDDLGAGSFLDRTTQAIKQTMAPYLPAPSSFADVPQPAAPAPTVAPSMSFDLSDWSPWRVKASEPASARPTGAAPVALPSLDDAGWFPWRETPKPEAVPLAAAGRATTTPPAPGVADTQQASGGPVAPSGTPVAMPTGAPAQAQPMGDIAEGDPQRYFETARPYADAAEREFGVPAALSLAISANETGYGQRRYMAGANNYHGIQDSTGAGTPYVDWRPGPNGEKVSYEARQAGFASPLEGFRGFARFLTENPRYKPALDAYRQTGDVNQLAAGIHKAGYAEDPEYTTKITSILRGIPVKTGVGEVTDSRGVGVQSAAAHDRAGEADRYDVAFGFNQAYSNPFNAAIPRHRGVDLTVRGGKDNGRGEPVKAFRGGMVYAVTSDPNGGNGLIVATDDPNAPYDYYGHFDATNVKQGQRIAPGEQVGVLGASGTEGFPHLHYEVRRNVNGDPMDALIDPTPYMRGGVNAQYKAINPEDMPLEDGPSAGDQKRQKMAPGSNADNAPAAMPGMQTVPGPVPPDRSTDAGLQMLPEVAPPWLAPPGRAGAVPDDAMYRQPLLPTDPEASTGAEYDPRDADQGAHEWVGSGESSGGSGASLPPLNDAVSTATTLPATTASVTSSSSPATYGGAGDEQGYTGGGLQPSGGAPTVSDTAMSGSPAAPAMAPAGTSSASGPVSQTSPSGAIPSPASDPGGAQFAAQDAFSTPPEPPRRLPVWNAQGEKIGYQQDDAAPSGRIQWPNERQLAPAAGRDTGEMYGPAPVPEPPSRWAPAAQEALAGTQANPEPINPPAPPSGPVEQAISSAGRAPFLNEPAAQQAVDIYSAIQELPFDVYERARQQLVSDAEAKRMAGTDPLAPFRNLGIPLPSVEDLNPEGRPASDVAAGLLLAGALPDPTDPLIGTALRAAGKTLGLTARGVKAGARAVGNALDAAPAPQTAAPGVQHLGSGVVPQGNPYDAQALTRSHVIPPDVSDTLDFPIRIPDDPSVIRAIEAAGGSVDPNRGVNLNVIRYQGPEAHGRPATRSGTFYTADKPGAPSPYATQNSGGKGVGGSDRIEAPTTYRSPLVLSDAPGSNPGFDEGMRQFAPQPTEDAGGFVVRNRRSGNRSQVFATQAEAEQYVATLPQSMQGDMNVIPQAARTRPVAPPVTGRDIDAGIAAARRAGPAGSPARANALKDLVRKYGGDEDVIDDLLAVRGADDSESAWAIKENILAHNARAKGYDGVLTVQTPSAPMHEIMQHPDVKAAKAARDAEHVKVQQAIARGATGAEREAVDAAYYAAQDALEAAKEAAHRELFPPRISELADFRESHNPTPGAPNPRIAEREAAIDRIEQITRDVIANPGRTAEESQRLVDELTTLRTRIREIDTEMPPAERQRFQGEPGYTLRPDLPRRPQSAGSGVVPSAVRAAGFNAAQGGVLGAGSESLQAEAEGRETDVGEQIRRGAVGAGLAVLAGNRAARGAVGMRARELGSGVVPEGRRRVSPPELRGKPITSTPAEEVSRLRLDKFPEPLRPIIQQAAEATGFAHDARRGVIPDAAAEDAADAIGRTVDDWIAKSKIGRALNTEETRALRNVVTGQAQKVDDLAQEIADAEANGVVTDILIARAHQEAEKLASLVPVMEGARAEAGRAMRAWRADPRPVSPTDAAQRIFDKFGGGPEGRQRALDAIKEFQQIPTDDPIARAGFWARVERGGKITSSDVLTAIRYNSMLSSPRTWEIGWIGSILQAPIKIASDVMAAASRPMSGEMGEAAKGAAMGLQAGIRPLWETIRHGITTDQALAGQLPRGLGPRATTPAGKVAGTLIDIPGRMVAAPDAFFTSIFKGAETGRLAAIRAHQAGLKGEKRAEFIHNFATNTPKNQQAEIDRVVDGLMLRGDMGRFGRWASGVATKDPLIGSFVAPFMKVSYHIWTQGMDLTPVGALGTGIDVLRGAYRDGGRPTGVRPLGERARANAIGVGITGAATWQALQGNVSGAGPDDPEKRQELTRLTGWQPYSVKMGDRWVSYANWGPVAVPLSLAAAYAENQQYKKSDASNEDQMFDMAKRVAKLTTEQTFLQGIGTIMNAFEDPQRYLPQLLAQQSSSLIPYGSALNTVAQSQDDYVRQPDRPADVGTGESVGQSIKGRIPMNPLTPDRGDVPIAQTPLGQPVENQQSGAMAFQPFRISRIRDDQGAAIGRAYLDLGVDIAKPPSSFTEEGVKIDMTPEQQRAYQRYMGDAIIRGFERANGASDRRRAEQLKSLYEDARTAAQARVKAEIGRSEIRNRVKAGAGR
jgi:murein DD-endopeptidase MepM/ murein hydrolase activator NlpD